MNIKVKKKKKYIIQVRFPSQEMSHCLVFPFGILESSRS